MDFFEVVHTQRSIRKFKPDPVPDEAIWKIVDAAIRAPSGSNSQPWAWMVVRDEGKKKVLADAIRAGFESAGRLQRMRENVSRIEEPTQRRMMEGAVELFSNVAAAPVLIIPCLVNLTSPVSDINDLFAGSSIYGAVQNLMLAARAQGLGTVLTTFNIVHEELIRKEFGLPDNARPVAIVPVGYPEGQRFGPTNRKPAETVTYWDSWSSTKDR
jgi:nitroreductase